MPTLMDTLATAIRAHYIWPDRVEAMVDALDRITDPGPDFGQIATATLRAVSGDAHLSVRRSRPQALDGHGCNRWEHEAGVHAGGIREVRRCAGAATVVCAPYLSPVELIRPRLAAAMDLVRGAEVLLLDLRQCRGGSPPVTGLVLSHLLGPAPVHVQDIVFRDGTLDTIHTRPDDVVPLDEGLRCAVLTSRTTFSGGEDIAYSLQALGRAAVVGEVTGGGAHPCATLSLGGGWDVSIPIGRSVNAVTGTNWEAVGVQPDVECLATDAEIRAREALMS